MKRKSAAAVAKPVSRPPGNYSTFRRFAYTMRGIVPSQTVWQAQFPTSWGSELSALQNYISQRERRWYMPYRALNRVLLLTIPSVVTPGFETVEVNEQQIRRLITAGDLPPDTEAITMMVRGWASFVVNGLTRLGPVTYREIRARLNGILNRMSSSDLNFERLNIELPLDPDSGGVPTAKEPYYYKALPAWIAKQLEGTTFEIRGHIFRMIRAQSSLSSPKIELVSWPPEPLSTGFLSLVLSFDVQTLPSNPAHPMLYPKLHARRWVYKSLIGSKGNSLLSTKQSSTVVVRTTVPWLPSIAVDTQALTLTSIKSKRDDSGSYVPIWDDNMPALLSAIGATPLPTAEEFAAAPIRFFASPEMACVMSMQLSKWLGKSPLGSGLFIGDLMTLYDQVDAYMQNLGITRVPDSNLQRIGLARTNRNKKWTAQTDIWQSLKHALGRRKRIRFEVFYQTREMAEAIWLEFLKEFGVESADGLDPFVSAGIEVKKADGISIHFRAVLNNYLSVEPVKGQDLASARVAFIGRIKDEQVEIPPDEVGLTIVELRNFNNSPAHQDRMKDAKRPLRYAFSDTKRLSQFVVPPGLGDEDEEETKATIKTKAHATVLDARRHLGFMGNDLSELLDDADFAPGTQLIGLHLEVRNVSRSAKYLQEKAVLFPCAVKLVVGQQNIEALVPSAEGKVRGISWEPYYEAELRVGRYSGSQLHMLIDRVKEGGAVIEQFLDNILEMEKDKQTIIFVSAKPWRFYWPWLQDRHIVFDEMRVNGVTYLSSHKLVGGNTRVLSNIRVIRFREGEVPAHLALDLEKSGTDQAGYGHGLQKVAERVFYSIAQKPDSYQVGYEMTRFLEPNAHPKKFMKNARMSAPVEIVPAFVQSGDNLEDFAKGFHLLRAATSHWTVGFTNFPLPAHLAKNLANDYVSMRVDLEDTEEDVENDEKEAE